MGFRYERWWILAHCGWKAFHDDHVGLDFGEPFINGPHCWSIGTKGVLRTDEHQPLRPFPVAGDEWNCHRAVARTPRFCLSLQFQ
jgi:hypothetical protein